MAKNRQINTGFKGVDSQEVTLEAVENTELDGDKMAAGDTKKVEKGQAKRILKDSKGKFRITMA